MGSTPCTITQGERDAVGGLVGPAHAADRSQTAGGLGRKLRLERLIAAAHGGPFPISDRMPLMAEMDALDRRLGELTEAAMTENQRPNFAGIESPLHEAGVACLAPDFVAAEFDVEAVKRQAGRKRRSAVSRREQDNAPWTRVSLDQFASVC
jgi:hypothetical protein